LKKYILGAAALAVALIGFGTLNAPTTQANATAVFVVNTHVAAALAGTCGVPSVVCTPAAYDTAITTSAATRATVSAGFAAAQTASAGEISADMPNAGQDYVIVQTNDAVATISLTGRGLVCAPVCDGVVTQTSNVTDQMAIWHVTGVGSFTGGTVTATQSSISLDSTTLKAVGTAHDIQLTVAGTPPKTTIQEGATTCPTAALASTPSNATADATYTDINGVALVGYNPTLATSAIANMAVGNSTGVTVGAAATSAALVTMVQADGKTTAAQDAICGIAAGTANLTATTLANEIPGLASPFTVTRTLAITITGVPAKIALTAAPSTIACDGVNSSTVTAKVTDTAGNNVVDNTPVTFSVVALGTANPIQAKTAAGSATSLITPLSVSTAGTTVIVTAGDIQASTRIDCALPVATVVPPAGSASPTPRGGIGGPDTGNGGYLNQNGASGFPMWTLIALALGSVTLFAGGVVTRRAGK